MNAQRTSTEHTSAHGFSALIARHGRAALLCLAAALLIALVPLASQAGLKPASVGGSGAVLALASQLRAARAASDAASGFAAASGLKKTPDGRTLQPYRLMRSGAILKSRAAASTVVPISEAVQTYDVANPSPAFRPLIGYGSATALNNNSSNPPVYISTLAPTNLTPVWSADETFLVFSSNRNALGGLNTDATDGVSARFHLWAISVNGGEAYQITTSTGPAGGGEFFPTLTTNNSRLAFVSDAQSPGTTNLYSIGFSVAAVTALPVGTAYVNVSNTTVVSSLTLRYGPGIVTGPQVPTEASSSAFTGFARVDRPTFGTSDGQLIVFSAVSVTGAVPNAGHSHLYYLYQSTGGFSSSQVSYPGKLTDGPADDTDPAFSPDGQFIAFSSTASAIGNNPNHILGPTPPSGVQDPNQSQSLTAGPVATRSIFVISGGGSGNGIPFGTTPASKGIPTGRVTVAGTDNYGPAWSNFANQNQFTNPAPGYAYLAFARAALGAPHGIYYLQLGQGISSPSSESLTPESGGNLAVHLNTDDVTGAASNAFENNYPSWSPFLSIFSITYASNRTVTYNNPANSQPTETANSVAEGGTVTNPQDTTASYAVGGSYTGLLVSQVLNLDPPSLLRFSQDEVVHVQSADPVNGVANDPVNGTPNKLAATGGQKITLTVRLSNREAGIDNTGGPNAGPRVYIQIKDPDSKYQDVQLLEHKIFMKDRRYDSPAQVNQRLNDVTSGTANALLDDYDFTLPASDLYSSLFNISGGFINLPFYQRYIYPSYGNAGTAPPLVGQDPVNYLSPRGTHGGQWAVDTANNPNNTYLFVGKSAVGTTNPYGTFSYPTPPPGMGRIITDFPGTDPNQFIPLGPEYECQLINPTFGVGGAVDAAPTDYTTPYYLAGIDDQAVFSGGTYNTGTAKDRPNTEWLQLTKVPTQADGKQFGDANGGVLYTATWTTPRSGSDFYVDVIAFDKAVFRNISGFAYSGQKTNWRIYDNVGGFSTNQSISNEDILVVSDYALGQKFAATTFGGRNFSLNLVPKLFGTESYLTDVDVNILPDSVYAGIPSAEAKAAASAGPPATAARVPYQFTDVVQPFGRETPARGRETLGGDYPGGIYVPVQNGLGAQSFIDPIINDNTVNSDGVPNVQSQRYSIWRILSRGPVPLSLLTTSYLPKPIMQPAIPDLNLPAATVLDANRCVIWMSPYTGDVLADPGTIDDPGSNGQAGGPSPRLSTTSVLTSFVQAGGRLCVTGQDVGSTLTLGGVVNNTPSATPGSPNFLPDVLNATLTSSGPAPTNVLTGSSVLSADRTKLVGNQISCSPFYTFYAPTPTQAGSNLPTSSLFLGSPLEAASYLTLSGPIQGQYVINYPNYPFLDNLVIGDADYGDSALSQMPAAKLPIGPATAISTNVQGQSDVIAPVNGAKAAMSYVIPSTIAPFQAIAGTAMVFHDDPYLGGAAGLPAGVTAGLLPNGGTGSRVVYAAFGLEALTQDYYASASPDSAATVTLPPNPLPHNEIIPVVIPRNVRSAILHNIVSYLRTGRVTGSVNTDDGSSPDNATVFLTPTSLIPNGPFVAPTGRAAFSASTGTGNNGRFTIFGVEPGTYTLVAVKSGYRRAVSNNGVFFTLEGDVTKTAAALTLTHLPPANIAGVVQDTNKAPIDGATVTFTAQDGSLTRTVTTANGSVPTNPADNYFVQGVPVTTFTATASGPLNSQGLPEYTSATAPDAPFAAGVTTSPNTTTDGVNFTLTASPASLAGTVVIAGTTTPIPGATVTLIAADGTTVATTTSAADGTYSFANIVAATAAANFTVTAIAPGYASNTITQAIQAGNVFTGIDIPLTPIPSGNITGTVTDARTGLPLGSATVTFTLTGGATQTATTAADGTYTISTIPTGTYSGVATGPATGQAYVASNPQSVVVANGATATANFALVPLLATITGTVTDASTNAALSGVTISVTDTSGNPVATTPATLATDGSGNYTATLLPGTYLVTASKAGYDTQTSPATAFALGATVTVSFKLVSSIGAVGGLVTEPDGTTPVANATVTVTQSGVAAATFTTSGTATTGPDGKPINYSGTLTKGSYTFVVSKGGRTSATVTKVIVGGAFNRVDFTAASNGVLPALYTFPAGIQLISTPFDYSSLGFDGLFGTLNTAPSGTTPNGNRSHAAVWNPLAGAYALDPTAPADSLRLGVGYWIYLKAAVPVLAAGAVPSSPFVAVPLNPGWNQIGVPNPVKDSTGQYVGVAVSRLMFDNGRGGMISYAQAGTAQYSVVDPNVSLYQYSGAAGYQPIGTSGTLKPWVGYWLYVKVPVTLEIPTN